MRTKIFTVLLSLSVVVFGVLYGVQVLAPINPQSSGNRPTQNSDISVLPMPLLKEEKKDTPDPTERETITPSVNQTADWKTYRNEKYGYMVKYPKGWNMIEAKPRVGHKIEEAENILLDKQVQKITFLDREHTGGCQGFQIAVLSNPEKLTLEQWIKKERADDEDGSILEISDTSLDGKPAKKLSLFGFDHERIVIIVFYKGYIFSINFYGNAPCDPEVERHRQIYQQMVSTFSFIE